MRKELADKIASLASIKMPPKEGPWSKSPSGVYFAAMKDLKSHLSGGGDLGCPNCGDSIDLSRHLKKHYDPHILPSQNTTKVLDCPSCQGGSSEVLIYNENINEAAKNREFFISQVQYAPLERYEVREKGDISPVIVVRDPSSGEWNSESQSTLGSPNLHVELVKRWIYKGRPNAPVDPSETPSATDKSPYPARAQLYGNGGYERPGFWSTSAPVGFPDYSISKD